MRQPLNGMFVRKRSLFSLIQCAESAYALCVACNVNFTQNDIAVSSTSNQSLFSVAASAAALAAAIFIAQQQFYDTFFSRLFFFFFSSFFIEIELAAEANVVRHTARWFHHSIEIHSIENDFFFISFRNAALWILNLNGKWIASAEKKEQEKR